MKMFSFHIQHQRYSIIITIIQVIVHFDIYKVILSMIEKLFFLISNFMCLKYVCLFNRLQPAQLAVLCKMEVTANCG